MLLKWAKAVSSISTGTRKHSTTLSIGESKAFLFFLFIRSFRGVGKFQIGDEIREVDANADPTLIIIPGNTPHQILNERDEPLMFFYYFPGESIN